MEIEDERSKPSGSENQSDHIEEAYPTCTSDKQIMLENEEPLTMTSPVKQNCMKETDSPDQSKNTSNEKANTFGLMGMSVIVNPNLRDPNIPKNDITASFIPSSNEGYRLFHPTYLIDFESESELRVKNIADPLNRSFSELSATINVTKTIYYCVKTRIERESSFQHRRFRNFKALHNSLARQYPTYVLPSLSEDIEFRQSNLELYISKLLSHRGFMKGTVLYLPHVLKRFLSTDPDFEEAREISLIFNKAKSFVSSAKQNLSRLIYGGGISSEHEAFLSVIAKKKEELKVLSEKVEPLILKCIEITEKKSYETGKALGLNQHIKAARSQFREYQSLIMSYIQRPIKVEWFEQGYRI